MNKRLICMILNVKPESFDSTYSSVKNIKMDHLDLLSVSAPRPLSISIEPADSILWSNEMLESSPFSTHSSCLSSQLTSLLSQRHLSRSNLHSCLKVSILLPSRSPRVICSITQYLNQNHIDQLFTEILHQDSFSSISSVLPILPTPLLVDDQRALYSWATTTTGHSKHSLLLSRSHYSS